MSVIIHFLQSGSYEEASEVLHRLRTSQNLQDTIRLVRDSQLMLPNDKSGGSGSRAPLVRLRTEESMESTNSSSLNSSAGASQASPITNPSIMQFDNQSQPDLPMATHAPSCITLPSLASLTNGPDGVIHGSPPQHERRTLPPLSISVGGGSYV